MPSSFSLQKNSKNGSTHTQLTGVLPATMATIAASKPYTIHENSLNAGLLNADRFIDELLIKT